MADAPAFGQLGFQDPATENLYAVSILHHSISQWLVAILCLVGGLLYAVLHDHYFHRAVKALRPYRERLTLTEDAALEFG